MDNAAAALAIGHRTARPWLALAIVLADIAIVWLPIVWLGVAVVLIVAAVMSRRSRWPAALPAA